MRFTGERIIPEKEFCGSESNIFKEHIARYKFARKFIRKKKVLDIACGVGYGSKILVEGGASEIYGCDISEEAIQYAKKKYSHKNIKYEIADSSSLRFSDEYFDCIVSFETLEHIQNYNKTLDELRRVLKKNGILIISTPNKDAYNDGNEILDNRFHYKEFSKNEFVESLNKRFSTVSIFSQRLIVKIGLTKKLLRKLIFSLIKLDFLRIHLRIFNEGTYAFAYKIIDDTDRQYEPIPYQKNHNPRNFLAICHK